MQRVVYSGKVIEFNKDTNKVTLEYFSNGIKVCHPFDTVPGKEEYYVKLVGEMVDIYVVDDQIKYINLPDDEEIF